MAEEQLEPYDLLKSPNYLAYQKDVGEGVFRDKGPLWLAYNDGQLVLSNSDKDAFFKALNELHTAAFVKQVNVAERVVCLPRGAR